MERIVDSSSSLQPLNASKILLSMRLREIDIQIIFERRTYRTLLKRSSLDTFESFLPYVFREKEKDEEQG
jgi:hypothetical protein